MAPGLKVGDLVKAKAVNVLGNRRAGDVFGPWAAKTELHGSVIECVGVGRIRKLKVKWNECDDISILSALSLELDDLFTSVEAYDYSEGRQGDLEEPGLSQLRPHGTEWLVETEGIQIDYYDGAKRNLDFIWTFDNPVEQRSPLEYFCAMFPMVEAAFWIEKTNAGLAEMKRKPLSKFEYFRFWELILAISIGSEKNRRNYWMEELDGEGGRIFQPPAFGTLFGMGIRRFEDILRCLSFGDEDCNDPWSPIRPFMDALNNRRQQVINPSHIIVEDELMSSWISRKQDRTADGIPHLTNIIQKPKGVGAEIKCVADSLVGIMLRIEICEGKEAESKKKWSHLPAVIDAMLAYNYERRVDAKSVEDFANDLALSLICNKFDGYELVSRRRLSDEPIAAEPSIP
eukprot:Em0023g215a